MVAWLNQCLLILVWVIHTINILIIEFGWFLLTSVFSTVIAVKTFAVIH